ncbi:tellurite resistance TerB C-terminal domain-containing protein, partial [Lactobacillus delbrueckii]|uniref:tellurite resistance TerB C-terminal domain-containing protein n=1 Tax=Lactobacillus delbrueckii TaxID=1584 RepID=UPI000A76DE70
SRFSKFYDSVKINLASLDQIRSDAAETKESLLTEEERQLEAEEAERITSESNKQVSESSAAEEKMTKDIDETAASGLGLDENEEQLLLTLFSGQPYQDFLRQRHLLLSVVVDQINEKIFDEIGDAVIDCDGQKAEIVEDYRSDLADLLGIEEK